MIRSMRSYFTQKGDLIVPYSSSIRYYYREGSFSTYQYEHVPICYSEGPFDLVVFRNQKEIFTLNMQNGKKEILFSYAQNTSWKGTKFLRSHPDNEWIIFNESDTKFSILNLKTKKLLSWTVACLSVCGVLCHKKDFWLFLSSFEICHIDANQNRTQIPYPFTFPFYSKFFLIQERYVGVSLNQKIEFYELKSQKKLALQFPTASFFELDDERFLQVQDQLVTICTLKDEQVVHLNQFQVDSDLLVVRFSPYGYYLAQPQEQSSDDQILRYCPELMKDEFCIFDWFEKQELLPRVLVHIISQYSIGFKCRFFDDSTRILV